WPALELITDVTCYFSNNRSRQDIGNGQNILKFLIRHPAVFIDNFNFNERYRRMPSAEAEYPHSKKHHIYFEMHVLTSHYVKIGWSLNQPLILYTSLPQHFLYFLPLPQGHGSFRSTLYSLTMVFWPISAELFPRYWK